MRQIDHLVRSAGGVISTKTLAAHGVGQSGIRSLLRRGALIRVRQGWYSAPGLAEPVRRAARVGGLLTCARALDAHGIWSVDDGRLHVAVSARSSRLRSPGNSASRLSASRDRGVRVHWLTSAPAAGPAVADPITALSSLRSCATRELYLASLDSALHRYPAMWDALAAAGHPVGIGGIDGVCESGIETLFWLRMRKRRSVQRQVVISGVGRVDFLVGSRLVIELDGRRYHDTASRFEEDRRRDALLSTRGFRVLRFSYRQVMDDWEDVEAAVLAAVRRGDHLT